MEISIIIPHYNRYEKLIRLINSIPKEEFIEIIVVDDNSTNLTEQQLIGLETMKEIRFFRNKTNKSAGFCRNLGISKAKGNNLVFADSDDYFITSQFYKIIKKVILDDSDIIFSPPIGENEDSTKVTKRGKKTSKKIIDYIKNRNSKNETKLRYTIYTPWSKIYKKNFIIENKIRYDEIKVSNDVMFTTKAGYHAEKINSYTETYYVCEESNDSLTSMKDYNSLKMRIDVYLEYLIFLKTNLSKKEKKHFRFTGLKYIYRNYKLERNFSSIKNSYKKLKKNNLKIFRL